MEMNDIINSREFRLLNFLIDQKVDNLRQTLKVIQSEIEYAFREGAEYPISTRTYEESGHSYEAKYEVLDVDIRRLKGIKSYFDDLEAIEAQISELVRFKLKLQNDYDFTHGDDTIQKQIFSNESILNENN